MTMDPDRRSRGLDTLQRIGGPDAAAPIIALNDLAPDLVRFAIEFAYGEVLSREGLTLKTRQLCTVAALSAMGTATFQLRWHIGGALNVGWQPSEIDHTIRHAVALTGSSSLAESLAIAEDVVHERQAPDPPGSPIPDPRSLSSASVAAVTAVANAPAVLEAQIREALAAGVRRAEIVEVIEQMAVYAGFPAALNALAVVRRVFDRY